MNVTFDAFLAERRGEASRLARALGVSPQQICDIRKGRSRPSLKMAVRLSRLTGIPVEAFANEPEQGEAA